MLKTSLQFQREKEEVWSYDSYDDCYNINGDCYGDSNKDSYGDSYDDS